MTYSREQILRQMGGVSIDSKTGRHLLPIYRSIFEGIIQPETVQTVLDLFCGTGLQTAIVLEYFNQSRVHAVDFFDIFTPMLKANPRVEFHPGRVVDVLASGQIPAGDIVIVANSERFHGFNQDNIHLLRQYTRGLLLTLGENGNLEGHSWFSDHFEYVRMTNRGGETVWKGR